MPPFFNFHFPNDAIISDIRFFGIIKIYNILFLKPTPSLSVTLNKQRLLIRILSPFRSVATFTQLTQTVRLSIMYFELSQETYTMALYFEVFLNIGHGQDSASLGFK